MSESTQTAFLNRLGDDKDIQAWNAFYEKYGALIRGFSLHHGLTKEECEDVVQDVYLVLFRHLPKFQYDRKKGRFRGYLKTVVRHTALHHLKKRKATKPLPEPDGSSHLPAIEHLSKELELAWEEEWHKYHIRQAMEGLRSDFNATDLAAFERFAIQGQSGADVAAELDLSLDQVYQAKARILKKLRLLVYQQIEEQG